MKTEIFAAVSACADPASAVARCTLGEVIQVGDPVRFEGSEQDSGLVGQRTADPT